MKNNSKKWVIGLLVSFVFILGILGGFVAVVDPYFHYHAPQSFVKYELNNERYQNNGVVKHFEYDAIITGSSMTQCFKPSELNELFSVNAIKAPFSGGSYKEVNDNLKVFANIYNLTDARYQEMGGIFLGTIGYDGEAYYPMPSRHFIIGAEYTF